MATGWVEHDHSRKKPHRARLRLDNGEVVHLGWHRTQAEAKSAWVTAKADAAADQFVSPTGGRTLFRDWLATFRAGEVHLEPTTAASKAATYENWLLPAFGDRPIGAISRLEVQRFVAGMNQHLAPRTVKLYFERLSTVLNAAVAADMIRRAPLSKINLPQIVRVEQRIFTLSELEAIASAMPARYRAVVAVLATGGLRVGELTGLRATRLDLFTGAVTIDGQLRVVDGAPMLAPPKTKAAYRTVKLPSFALDVVRQHSKQYESGPEGVVFATRNGTFFRPQDCRQVLARAGRKIGVDNLHPHDLRHTAVSLWIANGANAKQVQVWAGHGSIRVTYDIYGHLFPEHDQAVIDRLDEQHREARKKRFRAV